MGLMSAVCRDYLRRCEAAEVAPDEALLVPVIEVFQRLQADAGEGEAQADGEG
ncbi:MAG: hypothetical protein HWD60_09830 [Defluviicoccus sp.]|nr:MAG: hypothetical protein HWD60_09830 [Defluviicoccus sp.]